MQPPDPPEHISHSARETLERCAKSYFLSRIARAPKQLALWSAGGSAVHRATELYDLRSMLTSPIGHWDIADIWERSLQVELDKLREKEPEESRWRRTSEDVEDWRRLGLQFVQAYIDWRERSPWEIWTTPDGEPAIELDVSGRLPGCPVEIKGILDRVFYDPVFKKLWVLDLKTGKRPPKTPDQMHTYGALLEVKHGVRAHHGVPFMNRRGSLGKPFDLFDVTPADVGAVYGEAWAKVQGGEFPANGLGRECFICDVSAACAAKGGPLAPYYDPDSPGYAPPY